MAFNGDYVSEETDISSSGKQLHLDYSIGNLIYRTVIFSFFDRQKLDV